MRHVQKARLANPRRTVESVGSSSYFKRVTTMTLCPCSRVDNALFSERKWVNDLPTARIVCESAHQVRAFALSPDIEVLPQSRFQHNPPQP